MAHNDDTKEVDRARAPTPDASRETPAEEEKVGVSRKRKTSIAASSDEVGTTSKRWKKECDALPMASTTLDSPPPRGAASKSTEPQRRSSTTTEEEKRRGKRLFGGLMSTLNQSAGNKQQRRRQEIERRQLDKMQQQTAEEGKRRAEKRAALNEIRLEQQITWEEQVMRSKHAKKLKLAQFLRTKSTPVVYFLPWKLDRVEREIIEDQVRDCKASITRELEIFQVRKEKHLKRYGQRKKADAPAGEEPMDISPGAAPEPRRRQSTPPRDPTADVDAAPETAVQGMELDAPEETAPERVVASAQETASASEEAPASKTAPASKPTPRAHDMHDDSGDVLVEAEEDSVIY